MITNINDAVQLFSEKLGLRLESLRNNSFLVGSGFAVYSPTDVNLLEVEFRYNEAKDGWYVATWRIPAIPPGFFSINNDEDAEIG